MAQRPSPASVSREDKRRVAGELEAALRKAAWQGIPAADVWKLICHKLDLALDTPLGSAFGTILFLAKAKAGVQDSRTIYFHRDSFPEGMVPKNPKRMRRGDPGGEEEGIVIEHPLGKPLSVVVTGDGFEFDGEKIRKVILIIGALICIPLCLVVIF